MKVINFGVTQGKAYAEIKWKSGKISRVPFDENGVYLWEGVKDNIKKGVNDLLLSKEVWDFSGEFTKNLPHNLKWVGDKVSKSLVELESGYKITITTKRNKKSYHDYYGKNY